MQESFPPRDIDGMQDLYRGFQNTLAQYLLLHVYDFRKQGVAQGGLKRQHLICRPCGSRLLGPIVCFGRGAADRKRGNNGGGIHRHLSDRNTDGGFREVG